MPENPENPSLFAVDDDSAILYTLRMVGQSAGFSCKTFSDKDRLIQSLTQWRAQNPSHGGIALLDGMVASGSHGWH